jgi:Family of unknown function (DUF6081)
MTAAVEAWTTYDTVENWTPVHPPLPGGGFAPHDPNAQVSFVGDGVRVAIPEFSQDPDEFRLQDAIRFVTLSPGFSLPDDGPATFAAEMSVRSLGGSALDVRLGAASFNVVAERGGIVLDFLNTSARVCALYEQLAAAVGEDAAFSYLVESPLLPFADHPAALRSCEITLDRGRGSAEWRADGHTVYRQEQIEIPASVRFGFGIFTLLPFTPASAQRLQGRGIEAAWRRFRFRGAVPLEA